jgi:2-amino-4-hydroxy-6-hydroxymethyldihydropteridine diphosphokinase
MDRLESWSTAPLLRSSLWETDPLDCPPGSPPFVNAVVVLRPRDGETPESLLAALKRLEAEFGRRPKEVINEPRPLDLDLVAYGQEVRSTAQLTLPHPRAAQRRFVLAPLGEIAPGLRLPGQATDVLHLLQSMPQEVGGRVRRLEDAPGGGTHEGKGGPSACS